MSTLLSAPPEILEQIMMELEQVFDLATCAQICHVLRSLVYDSSKHGIWRHHFLAIWDDPRKCVNPCGLPAPVEDFDWRGEVQRRLRAQCVILDPDCCRPGELLGVLQTLVSMVEKTPPNSTVYAVERVSVNLLWIAAYLRESGFRLLDRPTSNMSFEEQQLLAHLHTHLGLIPSDITKERLSQSRKLLYNMHNYNNKTNWGPYLPDGTKRVNWSHMLAVQHVMSLNATGISFDDSDERIAESARGSPMTLPFCQSQDDNAEDDSEDDWAGVAGAWDCSFCFCDHRYLIALNQAMDEADGDIDIGLFEDPHFQEVFRSIPLQMSVTEINPNPNYPSHPNIRFVGDLGGVQTMSGTVGLTAEGRVRWQFVSGEAGNAIWSSEGIQVGSVKSNFGVIGTWTTIFHEEDDPIGPMWLHKRPNVSAIVPDDDR